MDRFSSYAAILARVLISLVFLLNAIGIVDQSVAAKELAERGAPVSIVPFLMFVGRGIELIGGLALLFGVFPRIAAVALITFLIVATYVGHPFWLSAGASTFQPQLINFFKNVATLGGLLFVAAISDQPLFIVRANTRGDNARLASFESERAKT
jgi:putative oxidoreductase